MHLNSNQAFVWLHILNIYGGFLGDKMFFLFLALQTELFSYKHRLLSTSSRNPIFSCEQVLSEVFGRFNTESAFWLELSEHAVKSAKETFKFAWVVFTPTDIHSHIQTTRVKANQRSGKLKCLSQKLKTIRNRTERKEVHISVGNEQTARTEVQRLREYVAPNALPESLKLHILSVKILPHPSFK